MEKTQNSTPDFTKVMMMMMVVVIKKLGAKVMVMMIFLCNVDGVVVPEAAVSWSGPISPTLLANFSGGDQG